MVIMVLDHARGFFVGTRISPTDLSQTEPILFFTRWMTHFCAPGFILLAGTSAFLFGYRKGKAELKSFLWKRGLLLIVLEVTIVKLGWLPEPFYLFTLLQVIWVLGWSMLLLSPLSHLSPYGLTATGAFMVISHNLLDSIKADNLGAVAFIWSFLHEPYRFEPIPGHQIVLSYPLIPWIGVMAVGFGLGQLFVKTIPGRRKKLLRRIGYSFIFAFIVLRSINVYGDPTAWSSQNQLLFTILSFLNCEKYPPSLSFLLMTLGPIFLGLAAFERYQHQPPGWMGQTLILFGRVPLFFYVAHLYLLRLTSLTAAVLRWGENALKPFPEGHLGSPEYPLWVAYLATLVAIVVLYPLCNKYASFKHQRSSQFQWLCYF